MSFTLTLIRHGESVWNQENRFTGWTDVDLSTLGRDEAREAGRTLKKNLAHFDIAFTSRLTRAIRTLWIILDELNQLYVPVHRHWRLNERHYGALQGLNKAETAAQYGAEQVKIWRRSFDTQPPPLAVTDSRFPGNDERYRTLPFEVLPLAESLKDTLARVVPYWQDAIAPEILAGKQVIVAAHGNSLRALIMHLDKISPGEILEMNIPTGVPLVYQLDERLKPIGKSYLGA